MVRGGGGETDVFHWIIWSIAKFGHESLRLLLNLEPFDISCHFYSTSRKLWLTKHVLLLKQTFSWTQFPLANTLNGYLICLCTLINLPWRHLVHLRYLWTHSRLYLICVCVYVCLCVLCRIRHSASWRRTVISCSRECPHQTAANQLTCTSFCVPCRSSC